MHETLHQTASEASDPGGAEKGIVGEYDLNGFRCANKDFFFALFIVTYFGLIS